MAYKFIIGVEGGGSTCRVMLGRADGSAIDKAYVGESASVGSSPLSATISTLEDTIDAMLAKHGISAEETHIALCLPGISDTARLARVKAAMDAYYKRDVPITSDAVAALLNVQNGLADGTGIFISGTGSMMLGHNGGTLYRLGGKGYPNDPYSGGGIARACLRAYMERKRPLREAMKSRQLPLAQAFNQFIARHNLASAETIDHLPARTVAALFPAILGHVTGRPEALPCINEIFTRHIDQCAADLDRFCREAGISHLGLTGSVAQRLIPFIAGRLPPGLAIRYQPDAIDGAFCYAIETARDPRFLQNLPVQRLDPAPHGTAPKARP